MAAVVNNVESAAAEKLAAELSEARHMPKDPDIVAYGALSQN